MKKTVLGLISLVIATMPMVAVAQNNIRSAFDAIIKCNEASISETHVLDRDPDTRVKLGQSDVYNFVLPANKINLVKKVIAAFDKDSQNAYGINRGKATNSNRRIELAVGDASGNGVCINEPGREYIYALFLAPDSDDPERKYRYAYGFNYKDDGGRIIGKLIVTYATTLKYRQQVEAEKQKEDFNKLPSKWSRSGSFATLANTSGQSWFEMLMTYLQAIQPANSRTRISLATKAYTLIRNIKDHPDVTEQDKTAARDVLKGMVDDVVYRETVLNRLLRQCLAGLTDSADMSFISLSNKGGKTTVVFSISGDNDMSIRNVMLHTGDKSYPAKHVEAKWGNPTKVIVDFQKITEFKDVRLTFVFNGNKRQLDIGR